MTRVRVEPRTLRLRLHQNDVSTNSAILPIIVLGGGGGFTRPIPGDGGADQLRRVPLIGRLSTDGTRGPEEIGYSRICPEADGPVQGSLARDGKGPVI